MGAPLPQSIKIAVIEGWLRGLSRNSIAEKYKIGAGTVSDIIQKARINIPDIDLMRGLAVALKKHRMDVDSFASLVRLKTVLDRIGFPEEKLETLLEEINVHCFVEGKSEKEFVSKVDELFEIAAELDTTIWGIDSQIKQKKMEIIELDKKIAKKHEEIIELDKKIAKKHEDLKR
jgi:transcriptional regulator with XRE-family HTH domain